MPCIPLFIYYCSNAFSCLLDSQLIKGNLENYNHSIDHIIYLDDLLVFGNAYVQTATTLLSALNIFKEATNLCINCFTKSIYAPLQHEICLTYGFTSSSLSLKYLEVCINSPKLTIISCIEILNKLHHWLTNWKKKLLSFVGRFQLTHYTIWSYLYY